MLIVLPVHSGDLPLVLLNLKLAAKLDPKCPFPALISAPTGFSIDELVTAATKWFSSVTTHRYDDWRGSKEWPRPQNFAWQTTARFISTLNPPPTSWFWWESDATPLKSGWLNALANVYQQGARPFAGHIVPGPLNGHMNGVAIYPPDIAAYSVNSLLTRAAPFDRMLSKDVPSTKITPLNDLIGHYLKPEGRTTLPLECAADAESILSTSVLLYHGSSDGTFARYLLDPSSLPSTAPARRIIIPVTPSFISQTEWPSGCFALPTTPNTVYFNCSIAPHNGALHLFTRRFRRSLPGKVKGSDTASDLAIFRLDGSMGVTGGELIPTLPRRHPLEQWEDPRVMLGTDGRVYASFVTWVHARPWKFHQVFTRMSRDLRSIEAVDDPIYGGNGSHPSNGTAHEKNWTWFQHEGKWHCRYSIHPSDVFALRNGVVTTRWQLRETRLPWKHSFPLRGGTPPIRVGDEYISFFHSHLPWNGGPRRRYFMGAFAFEARAPFALTRMTAKPLLAGSEADSMRLPSALPCIFPNGALLLDQSWLVTFGVNDEACGWIKIPQAALNELLEPVKPTLTARLAKIFA